MRFALAYTLEKSDHDGYCSGEECLYTQEDAVVEVTVDNPYVQAMLQPFIEAGNLTDFDWLKWVLEPKNPAAFTVNTSGSYYCDLEDMADAAGLDRHEIRVVVRSAVLL